MNAGLAPDYVAAGPAVVGESLNGHAKRPLKGRIALAFAAVSLGALLFFATRSVSTAPRSNSGAAVSAGGAPSQPDTHAFIRFYEGRVKRDPEDARSQNALAELYLQAVRDTGNEDYLPRALGAARASLAAVLPERNVGGITALAHAEFANHSFAATRDHALALINLEPGKSEPFAILGDARLELGDYDGAAAAFAEMKRLKGDDPGTESRLGRLVLVRGQVDEARSYFLAALNLAAAARQPAREMVAWCRWQLGETAFSVGDYAEAEHRYREALAENPDYFRALASLGRLQAARGDLLGAIDSYERAVRIVPAIDFMAALGDLYQLTGRARDAAARYELVEQLGEHSRVVHNSSYDRNLAFFRANHDVTLEEAYTSAHEEYASGRRDIYGADVMAWTAFKTNRLEEAQAAMNEALKLETRDARLFYHAGMIARAAGDKPTAVAQLQRALALNPGFDPLQAAIARRVLHELSP